MTAESGRGGIVQVGKTLKHSFSRLPDVAFDLRIDHLNQVVTVASTRFDSYLIGRLVTTIVPDEHGVVAFEEDDIGWHPPLPTYALRIRIGGEPGIEFAAQVVRLSGAVGGWVAVSLTDPQVQDTQSEEP